MWKNRGFFTLTLLAGVSLIIWYKGSNMGYIIVYSLLMLWLISAVSIIFAPFFIKPVESLSNLLTAKNQKTDYTILVKNRGMFLYPKMELIFFGDDLVKYHGNIYHKGLGPFEKVRIGYELSVPYRGVYRAGISAVVVTDFLGLFKKKVASSSVITITVYPEYDDKMVLPIKNEAQIPAMTTDYRLQQDNTAVSDVRGYISSDSPKSIHWQLSAKRGELMVKNYSPLVTKNIVLYIDSKEIPLPEKAGAAMEDIMVSSLASGVHYSVAEGLGATLIYGKEATSRTPLVHTSEMERVLGILASLRFEESHSTIGALSTMNRDYNYVLYLSEIDEKSYGIIQQLISYENKMIIFFFYSEQLKISQEEDTMLKSLEEYGAVVNRIKNIV